MYRILLFLVPGILVLSACPVLADDHDDTYVFGIQLDFTEVDSDRKCVPVRVRVEQNQHLLRELSWTAEDDHLGMEGEGLERDGDEYAWTIGESGGQLDYCVRLNHRRSEDSGYDSRLRRNWAVFRGDDLFPPAKARTRKGARSDTRVTFELPRDWAAATPYRTRDNRTFFVDNAERRFDRPTGWMTAGEIGRRKDTIADTRIVVAGPKGHGFQRLEVLVLLGYTLESVRDYFPDFPERLAIIGAGTDMWRGALSGPNSLFIHTERPLVSGNATSTLLHELGHIGLGRSGVDGADWIVEGLVEYLSFHILHRTGGLSDKRYRSVMKQLEGWAEESDNLDRRRSEGPTTARAVLVIAALHEELGDDDFTQLVNDLAGRDGDISLAELQDTAGALLGQPAESLHGLPLENPPPSDRQPDG